MPFEPEIPTLAALVARALADIDSALGIETALLDTAPEYVLATNNATMAHGNYLAIRAAAKNVVPSADNDEDALAQHARLWLGNDDGRRAASPATLTIVGTGTAGTIIPAGTRFRRNSDSALYETSEELEFETDDVEVMSIAADEDEAGWGESGNTTPGATLTLVDEVAGLDAEWTVDGDPEGGEVGGGADQETHAELAARVEFRAQNPPRGGTRDDYEAWALEVSGIGQAWAHAGLAGPGTITVYVVRDDYDDPFPDAELLANVLAHVADEAPAQAGTLSVLSPTGYDLDPVIALKPNTTATRAAATAAMIEVIALRATPGQEDNEGYFDRSWLTEALSSAVGETGHTLTTPAADVTVTAGQLVRLGTPSYSTKE